MWPRRQMALTPDLPTQDGKCVQAEGPVVRPHDGKMLVTAMWRPAKRRFGLHSLSNASLGCRASDLRERTPCQESWTQDPDSWRIDPPSGAATNHIAASAARSASAASPAAGVAPR